MRIVHTNGQSTDFFSLCEQLDKSLNSNTPGRKEAGLNSLYDIENIRDVFLLYKGKKAIGSAGLWQHDDKVCELIRVFIIDEYRGNEYAGVVVKKVEELAKAKGYKKIMLRTWSSTPYAVRAYAKLGFAALPATQTKYFDKFPKALALSSLRVFMEKDLK